MDRFSGIALAVLLSFAWPGSGCQTPSSRSDAEPTASARSDDHVWSPDLPMPERMTAVTSGVHHTCWLSRGGEVVCRGACQRGETGDSKDGESAQQRVAFGQCDVPEDGAFASVEAGWFHTCGIRADGRVRCWGRNREGQADPPEGTFEAVDAGKFHTCGVRPDGSMECWGGGEALSRAGLARHAGEPPEGPFSDLAVGRLHTCGLRDGSGRVDCWGVGAEADVERSADDVDQAVPPDGAFRTIDAWGERTCGLRRADGRIECWGRSLSASLDEDEYRPNPHRFGRYRSLSVGGHHVCAVRDKGGAPDVVCFGDEAYGQGHDDRAELETVAAGRRHTCGIGPEGRIDCWGREREYPGDHRRLAVPGPQYASLQVGAVQLCASEHRRDRSPIADYRCTGSNVDVIESLQNRRDDDSQLRLSGMRGCATHQPRDNGSESGILCWNNRRASRDPATTEKGGDETPATEWYAIAPPDASYPEVRGIGMGPLNVCWRTGSSPSERHCRGLGTQAGVAEGTWDVDQGVFPRPSSRGAFYVGVGSGTRLGTWFGCTTKGGQADEAVRCWGRSAHGIVHGATGRESHGPDKAVELALGRAHACVRQADGDVDCWGLGSDPDRDEGDGDYDQAVAPDVPMSDLTAGPWYTCGIAKKDGALHCWGASGAGQADPPEGTFDAIRAASLPPDVEAPGHTCGIRADRRIVCWGGRHGDVSRGPKPEGADRVGAVSTHEPSHSTTASAAFGGTRSCVLDEAGEPTCRGRPAVPDPNLSVGPALDVAVGFEQSCTVRRDRSVACWGGHRGAYVVGARAEGDAPTPRFQSIEVGYHVGCGITLDGTLRCWEDGTDRRGRSPNETYGRAGPPSGTFASFALGRYHGCGRRADGSVACWGIDRSTDRDERRRRRGPRLDGGQTQPPSQTYEQLAAGGFHTCGIRADGALECWGLGSEPCRRESKLDVDQAVAPEGTFRDVAAGLLHTCALRENGELVCWGLGMEPSNRAEAGRWPSDGDLVASRDVNQASPPAGTFQQVLASAYTTCAERADGTIACWGLGTDPRRRESSLDYNQSWWPDSTIERVERADDYQLPERRYSTVSLDVASSNASTIVVDGRRVPIEKGSVVVERGLHRMKLDGADGSTARRICASEDASDLRVDGDILRGPSGSPPDRTPRVTVESIDAPGDAIERQVEAAIGKRMEFLRDCLRRGWNEDALLQGVEDLTIAIGYGGGARNLEVNASTLHHEPTRSCVRDLLERFRIRRTSRLEMKRSETIPVRIRLGFHRYRHVR